MIALILSVCLISDPGVCRDQTIPLDTNVSSAGCLTRAPFRLAEWSEAHPLWRVVRWRCGPSSEREI